MDLENATNSWTTTENIDVTTGNEYKVAGTSVLIPQEYARSRSSKFKSN